jgi:hypothetical protein
VGRGNELRIDLKHVYHGFMAKVTVELPDEIRDRLGTRAAEEGFDTPDAYLAALIREDVIGTDFGAPDHLRVTSHEDLEAKLLEGLASPAAEMAPGDWADLRRRLIERHGGK